VQTVWITDKFIQPNVFKTVTDQNDIF